MNDLRKSKSEKSAEIRKAHAAIARYLERNRGNRQYRHAPSAGWAAGKVLRPLAKKFGPGKATLQNHWQSIIGEKWAALSRPLAMRSSKNGKTLIIEARGPACALIQADASRILAKVNQFLGAGTVRKISVKQGHMGAIPQPVSQTKLRQKPMQLHSKLEQSVENRIQSALDTLGHKLKTKHK